MLFRRKGIYDDRDITQKKWSKHKLGTEYSSTRRSFARREQPIIYNKMILNYSIHHFTDKLVNLCTKSGEKFKEKVYRK